MRVPIALTLTGSIVLVITWCVPHAHAELSANQIVIIANANSRESLAVAEHYAARRGVPKHQIAKLDLPLEETMSRVDYDRRLVSRLYKDFVVHIPT